MRQFRRVYDLEVNVSNPEMNPLDAALNQINNTLLALSHFAAQLDSKMLEAYLGAAVIASREQGSGDNIVYEIYQKALPGRPLPTTLSSQEFAKKVKESKS